MKKFASINKRSSQLFLTKRAQTLLKIASIYDEFGDYNIAQKYEAEAFKYSKYIKIAEDLSEEGDLLNEIADVETDIENVPLNTTRDIVTYLTPPDIRHPLITRIDPEHNLGEGTDYIYETDFGIKGGRSAITGYIVDYQYLVKLVISWLSEGGNNIYNCLKSLSDHFIKTKNELSAANYDPDVNPYNRSLTKLVTNSDYFSKILNAAFSIYFKSPGFFFDHYLTLIHNIKTGNITDKSVAFIKDKIIANKESYKISYDTKDEIIKALPELPSDPELAHNIVSYLLLKIFKHETSIEKIKDIDVKKLSLAILYGNNDYQIINLKYAALQNLPENLAMSVIQNPLEDFDNETTSSALERMIGFKTGEDVKSPVYKFLLDYLARNPQVGSKFRLQQYPLKIEYNELLYVIKLISPDKIDDFLIANQSDRFKSGKLGRYLYEEGSLPDYETVNQEIENVVNNRLPWENLNYYILYKADKEKTIYLLEKIKNDRDILYTISNVNLVIVDPNQYLDYIIKHIDHSILLVKTNEFSLAYTILGSEIFNYPPVLISELCNKLSKSINYDSNGPYEFIKNIIANNPNFHSYTKEQQRDAVNFYKQCDLYANISYDKILNFQDFSKIEDTSTAANHMLLFGELTPDWIERTPKHIGVDTDINHIKTIGQKIKQQGFLICTIDSLLYLYNKNILTDEEMNRPIQELSLAYRGQPSPEEFKRRLITIDEVKKSIEKAAKINPEYAALVPGSRDYYYMVMYLSDNYSLRGQSIKSFFTLRDLNVKSEVIYNLGLTNTRLYYPTMIFTLIDYFKLEPNSEIYKSISNIISKINQRMYYSRYHQNTTNRNIRRMVDLLSKHQTENGINFDNINIDDIDEVVKKEYQETALLNLVDNLQIKLTDKTIMRFDGSSNIYDPYYNKISNTVSIFGRLLPIVIDKFAQTYGRSENVRNLESRPDDMLREFYAKFIDNIPKKIQDYRGFAQFFIQRMKSLNDLGQIRKIGENWNSNIKIFDEQNKVISTENLRDVALRYSLEQLKDLLSMTVFSEIYEDYENADRNFAKVYCDYDSTLEDDTQYQRNQTNSIYPHREKIYLDGLSVPLPAWANFKKTVEKPGTKDRITLRFLPRSDARGLYLGVIASVCQHPDGEAACCAVDGQVNPRAAFMVFELNNELIGECYTWEDGLGNICLDSFETIGDEAYHSKTTKELIENLIYDFGKAQTNSLVTIGNNKFNFIPSLLKLKNPTQAYKDYIATLSYKTFYRKDHENQFIIADNRDEKYDQEEYDTHFVIDYEGNICPLCGNNSLNDDDECEHCDYDSDKYSECPKCELQTLDDYGECQNRACDFTYTECVRCEVDKFNSETNTCDHCGYNPDNYDECPLCGDDTLYNGNCESSDCGYDSNEYKVCPNCDEYTVDDNGRCFKCGYDEGDEEEDEDE